MAKAYRINKRKYHSINISEKWRIHKQRNSLISGSERHLAAQQYQQTGESMASASTRHGGIS